MAWTAPLMPHEVDAHPDAGRINATIEAATAPLLARIEALEEELGAATYDLGIYQDRADDAELGGREAYNQMTDERDRRVALSNAAEFLLIGLIKGDRGKVRKGLADLAACGVAEELLTTVEAAEIGGHADFLVAG